MKKKTAPSGAAFIFALLCVLSACGRGGGQQDAAAAAENAAESPAPVRVVGSLLSENTRITPQGEYLLTAEEREDSTVLRQIDIRTADCLRALELEGNWRLYSGSLAAGRAALWNGELGQWMITDRELNECGRFSAPDDDGLFCLGGSVYLYVDGGRLRALNTADGIEVLTGLPAELRYTELLCASPAGDRAAAHFMLSSSGDECGTAVINLAEGAFEGLPESAFEAVFTDSGLCLSEPGGELLMEAEGEFYRSGEAYPMPVTGSDYSLTEDGTLIKLGATVSFCDIQSLLPAGDISELIYLPELELITGAVRGEGKTVIFTVDPGALEFGGDRNLPPEESPLFGDRIIPDEFWGAIAWQEIPEHLEKTREHADLIEREYSVRILLSGQSAAICALSGFDISPSPGETPALETARLDAALSALEKTLAMYPEGFFEAFRTGEGGGVCFMLTGGIKSGYDTVGCYFPSGKWYNIAIDAAQKDPEASICHEIWHACEEKILSVNPGAFEGWDSFNPENFSYYGDYATALTGREKWTFFSPGAEEVCFVDGYARVNAREDRARIMEYIMARDAYAPDLAACGAINGKLRIMSAALRECLGGEDWDAPRWERFF